MKLRPYQIQIIEETRARFKDGIKRVLIQLPTGGGKTALTAHMIKTASEKGLACLFIVHRRELIEQSSRAFDLINVDYGIISAGFKFQPEKKVQIASIQTLINKLFELRDKPSLVVFDEAHHCAAANWAKVHNHYDLIGSYLVGLSATPMRLDGKGLREFFDIMVRGPTVEELMNQKFLADYKAFAPKTINEDSLKQIKTVAGEYNRSQLSELMEAPKVIGDCISEYKKHASGKKAVVFCAGVHHSLMVRNYFIQNGITAEHLDGTTPKKERAKVLEMFKSGYIKILCNVDLFCEGFDIPDIEAVILCRPTKSLSLFLQQVGRALRPTAGKDRAIIIDHVRNLFTHGLPDEDREWTLDGVKKRPATKGVAQCPNCFAAFKVLPDICPYCDADLKPPYVESNGGRRGEQNLKTDDALTEIDKTQFRKTKIDVERSKAKTKDELLALAISRGYAKPHGWVHHIMQSRQRKKLNK